MREEKRGQTRRRRSEDGPKCTGHGTWAKAWEQEREREREREGIALGWAAQFTRPGGGKGESSHRSLLASIKVKIH